MTGSEIRNAAESYLGTTIEDDIALIAINEALRVIGDMGLNYGDIRVTNSSPTQTHYLPEQLTNVRRVLDSQGNTYNDWEQHGDTIWFKDAGDYAILARRMPSELTKLSDTPDVPLPYHNSLVKFLRLFVLQSNSPEPRDKLLGFGEFEQDVMRVFTTLRRSRQPKIIKVVR